MGLGRSVATPFPGGVDAINGLILYFWALYKWKDIFFFKRKIIFVVLNGIEFFYKLCNKKF